jgi:hypothetical protein
LSVHQNLHVYWNSNRFASSSPAHHMSEKCTLLRWCDAATRHEITTALCDLATMTSSDHAAPARVRSWPIAMVNIIGALRQGGVSCQGASGRKSGALGRFTVSPQPHRILPPSYKTRPTSPIRFPRQPAPAQARRWASWRACGSPPQHTGQFFTVPRPLKIRRSMVVERRYGVVLEPMTPLSCPS